MRGGDRRFRKGEALGNDYLLFPEGAGWPLRPEAVRLICDRRRGPGADGLVLYRAREPGAGRGGGFRVRIFNPDGSEAERSGNGLRILGAALRAAGEVGDEPFPVAVGGGVVRLHVVGETGEGGWDVVVGMGRARFGPGSAGLDAGRLDPRGRLPVPGFGPLPVHPVSVGNPHAVLLAGEEGVPGAESFPRVAPLVARHPAFPGGTNVQLVRPLERGRLEVRVWERGVGETPASGTSACAAAAVAVRSGLAAPGRVVVAMPGGELLVTVEAGFRLTLRGPARVVYAGELEPALLERLRGGARGGRPEPGR